MNIYIRPKTHLTSVLGLLATCAVAFTVGACDVPSKNIGDESDSGDSQCTPGAEMPAEDGCNTCVCTDGGEWSCTEIDCGGSSTGGGLCTPGEQKPADDDCNTCTCTEEGDWACTEIACGECTPGEVKPDPDPNSCGTCSCTPEGQWLCSSEPCPDMCTPGEMKPADDGCNTCECSEEGDWLCTEKACLGHIIEACADLPGPVDPHTITAAEFAGDLLTLDITTSGGCEQHIFDGCYIAHFDPNDPGWSTPYIVVIHDSKGDPCEAEIDETVVFDLQNLKLYWQEATENTHDSVDFTVTGWDETFVYPFN